MVGNDDNDIQSNTAFRNEMTQQGLFSALLDRQHSKLHQEQHMENEPSGLQ
ncbi:hypothetical protein KSF78_0003198 [Schistosoma japonicum]|nr:hypothetical protein KSF78_0003198 [Schistosoma japonicum]